MKLAIIGTGHVGLVTGVGFAEIGHEVICQDVDEGKVTFLKAGRAPIYEPGLQELLDANIDAGRLTFTSSLTEALAGADVLFICVGTPPNERGESNLTFVEQVARQIAESLKPGDYKLIVDKSTVPVKTAERVRQTVELYSPAGAAFGVASNPEFLREGCAVVDTMEPSRLVVGVDSPKDAEMLRAVYEPLIQRTGCEYLQTDIRSAELIKHVANAFLSTKLSFINMVARVCDATGAMVDEVVRGIGLDPRIGTSFFRAGIGYGGSCFPKDVPAFAHIAAEHDVPAELLWAVHDTNNTQPQWFFEKIAKALWIVRGKPIAVWGLAFKQDTDDVRESPALKVIKLLLDAGAHVRATDPKAMQQGKAALTDYAAQSPGKLALIEDPLQCCDNADALVVGTEWPLYAEVDPVSVKRLMRLPLVFDGKNLLDATRWRDAGFTYQGVGRPTPRRKGDNAGTDQFFGSESRG